MIPAVVHMTKYTTTSVHYPACLQAYKDSGDTAATKPGDRIWIAEMYGYAFGAANLDIWHHWAHDFMLYPSYTPARECGKGTWLHTRGGGCDAFTAAVVHPHVDAAHPVRCWKRLLAAVAGPAIAGSSCSGAQ
jgi:hypothetical protein